MSQDLLKHMVGIPADLQLCCLRLLNAKPGVENELRLMYDLSNVAGVKAVLKDHEFLPKENAINVYGGTANLYFGCTFGGSASKSSTAATKKGSKKDPSWMVSEKLFLHDVWINKVYAPLKKAGLKLDIPAGESMENAATKRLLGGDLKSFGKIHQTEVPNSIHTSKVLHGRGPEGYLELAPEVLKKAHKVGLITELPSNSPSPTPPAPPSKAPSLPPAPTPPPPNNQGGAIGGIDFSKITFN